MPEFILAKTHAGLRGVSQEDESKRQKFDRFVDELGPGEMFRMAWKQPRNLAHHRKFFALVTYVADNSDTYDNKAKALVAVKIAAGHVDWIPSPVTGDLVPVPKTINWDDMEQGEFDEFYQNAVQGVITHLLPHMNRVALEEALDVVARY